MSLPPMRAVSCGFSLQPNPAQAELDRRDTTILKLLRSAMHAACSGTKEPPGSAFRRPEMGQHEQFQDMIHLRYEFDMKQSAYVHTYNMYIYIYIFDGISTEKNPIPSFSIGKSTSFWMSLWPWGWDVRKQVGIWNGRPAPVRGGLLGWMQMQLILHLVTDTFWEVSGMGLFGWKHAGVVFGFHALPKLGNEISPVYVDIVL